jgi:hypothetical protein
VGLLEMLCLCNAISGPLLPSASLLSLVLLLFSPSAAT